MPVDNNHRLTYVGPPDPDHRFPMWFEDETGTRLDLVLTPDRFAPETGGLPFPARPVSFPDNFPDEGFYFTADAEMAVGGAGQVGRARLILALEAAFSGTGEPAEGTRVVFSRIRVRMDDVIPGAEYVVTHPYGQTRPLIADEDGRVIDTEDLGVAEEDFETVLRSGHVAPFLRATDAPDGHLGDGASETPVTGSPFGTNMFRVDGPRVGDAGGPTDPDDPDNIDRIQTDLFVVQGRLATAFGAEPTRMTYSRGQDGTTIVDAFARTAPGQEVELLGRGVPRTAFVASEGDYVARAQVPAPPQRVEIANVLDVPITRTEVPVVDEVIGRATYDPTARTLLVQAQSSDAQAPKLTVEGIGDLPAPEHTFDGVTAVPSTLTITSSAGGRADLPVVLAGAVPDALPVVADAGPDQTAITGRVVTLDGSSSRGDIVRGRWTQQAGTAVTLDDPSAIAPTFTAPEPGALTFALTVDGPGGSATDSLDVVVTPAPPPNDVTVDRAEFRTRTGQFRIAGTASGAQADEVTVTFDGTEIGRGPVTATGDWDVRRTVTAAEPELVPGVGSRVEASTPGSEPVVVPVSIRA
ncbi:PKD domain-containing protein [Luteipulveratus halotolerans]|uniref:Uncharacterized protein n=1 Tax=Luteipulveratus halotolerans TaxID=1631356 RepID=A0A0L6CJT1_9MICO|nr:PKD domain-containing protein [Luteipulveratus halotolerans]KNX37974.1 hypothetical protein VV01_13730 [Luteipulveratus halotolerans]